MPPITPDTLLAPRGRAISSEQGMAMMEFVLVMPVIALVLALVFNFGQVFLERQRTMVAAREIGLRHATALQGSRDPDINPMVDAVVAENLTPRGMSATLTGVSDGGECARDGETVNTGGVDGALSETIAGFGKLITAFAKGVSASNAYEIEARGRPMFVGLARDPVYRACFAVDGGTWTSAQVGGPLELVKNLLAKLGGALLGPLFK